ncbi:MAG: metal ABC transporter substrate-binding protein [Pygmaiobacter sp.]|nr:metal ABC transporter substrate-binding protein [Pygmaiobacter sp.]
MLKRFSAAALVLFLLAGLTACGSSGGSSISAASSPAAPSSANSTSEKLNVSVSFNAIKEFAEAIGKDKVEVSTIIPDGMEPHDFEPKAQDLVALSGADVFIYNGLGMEAWAEKAIIAAGNTALITVDASAGADAIKSTDPAEVSEHGQYDPHLWLSITGAKTELENIKNAFVKADPANESFYETNYQDYTAQLDALYQEYSEKFKTVESKSFVTGHAAFGYLCRDFGLEQNSVEDVFAEGEPTAQQLAELVDYCRTNHVTTVFAEEMASPDVSNTLANEVGATVQTIYTMESAEDDLSYLQRMESNLSKIYDSLTK